MTNKLIKEINKIGQAMITDPGWKQFNDIESDFTKGRIPRCLYFEENRKGKPVIIVGMNPGRASDEERRYFKNQIHQNYEASVKFWHAKRKNYHGFYGPLRELMDLSQIKGPILWTELVKCQSKAPLRKPLVNTIRYGISQYLDKEISLFPKTTIIIAVGNEAYNLLSYVYPDRKVVGVPHPSPGSIMGNYAYRLKGKISSSLTSLIKKEFKNSKIQAVQFIYNRRKKQFEAA